MEILSILQLITHYSLHIFFPGVLALLFFKHQWKTAWFIMMATMLVDIDHLLASPIFDPTRCSIGFHPLHSYIAIFCYLFMLFIPNSKVRMVATGLLFHILTDFQDCFWITALN